MGVPNSVVGYTPAMPRREDHEVHKDMGGGALEEKKKKVKTTKQPIKFIENLKEK